MITIEISKDDASPALDRLQNSLEGAAVQESMGRAGVNLLEDHFKTLADGRVWEWGDNGARNKAILTELPVIVQIDASGDSTIAIDADGTVFVWGADGQPMKYCKEK